MKNPQVGSYWVCVAARNAAAHLPSALSSLLSQTLQPVQIIAVNDGSSDSTSAILADYQREQPEVKVLNLPDSGYDIRRVPRNINLAWKFANNTGIASEHFMISGDDCVYPRDYVRTLISKMASHPRVVVASGRPRSGGSLSQEHSPSGSGRLVKCSFWRALGERYPIRVGWETWLLYKAQERGLEVGLFDDLVFEHARPRGTMHQFTYWGAAMCALGYHPLYACGRIARNLIGRKVALKGSLNMLRGYLLGFLDSSDPFVSPYESSLRRFVSAEQSRRITNVARAVIAARTI